MGGESVGDGEGVEVGDGVGLGSIEALGSGVGLGAGVAVGSAVALGAGLAVGSAVGLGAGVAVGSAVALGAGLAVGSAVGLGAGVAVGAGVALDAGRTSTLTVAMGVPSESALRGELPFTVRAAAMTCDPSAMGVTLAENCPSLVARMATMPSGDPSHVSWNHSRPGKPLPVIVNGVPATGVPLTVSDASAARVAITGSTNAGISNRIGIVAAQSATRDRLRTVARRGSCGASRMDWGMAL
jgi:hypothetical protein